MLTVSSTVSVLLHQNASDQTDHWHIDQSDKLISIHQVPLESMTPQIVKYSPVHLYDITPGECPHLCSLAAHTLRRFYRVGPASPWFRHISAETLDFCSEHSEGSPSISLGRVHPHLPDIYLSPEPTPARHHAGFINHIHLHSKTACQTCGKALITRVLTFLKQLNCLTRTQK